MPAAARGLRFFVVAGASGPCIVSPGDASVCSDASYGAVAHHRTPRARRAAFALVSRRRRDSSTHSGPTRRVS
jgi:hypothetical protein